MGLNKVQLIGNVGRDPEFRVGASGVAICNLTIATTEYWYDDGEKKEKTEWHRVVAFGKTAETFQKYVTKGKQLYIEGALQTRSYDAEGGGKKYTTEIIVKDFQFLGGGTRNESTTPSETPPKPDKPKAKTETKSSGFKKTEAKQISVEDEINDVLGGVPVGNACDVPF
jgi:single-strand DNA-binding protein